MSITYYTLHTPYYGVNNHKTPITFCIHSLIFGSMQKPVIVWAA